MHGRISPFRNCPGKEERLLLTLRPSAVAFGNHGGLASAPLAVLAYGLVEFGGALALRVAGTDVLLKVGHYDVTWRGTEERLSPLNHQGATTDACAAQRSTSSGEGAGRSIDRSIERAVCSFAAGRWCVPGVVISACERRNVDKRDDNTRRQTSNSLFAFGVLGPPNPAGVCAPPLLHLVVLATKGEGARADASDALFNPPEVRMGERHQNSQAVGSEEPPPPHLLRGSDARTDRAHSCVVRAAAAQRRARALGLGVRRDRWRGRALLVARRAARRGRAHAFVKMMFFSPGPRLFTT